MPEPEDTNPSPSDGKPKKAKNGLVILLTVGIVSVGAIALLFSGNSQPSVVTTETAEVQQERNAESQYRGGLTSNSVRDIQDHYNLENDIFERIGNIFDGIEQQSKMLSCQMSNQNLIEQDEIAQERGVDVRVIAQGDLLQAQRILQKLTNKTPVFTGDEFLPPEDAEVKQLAGEIWTKLHVEHGKKESWDSKSASEYAHTLAREMLQVTQHQETVIALHKAHTLTESARQTLAATSPHGQAMSRQLDNCPVNLDSLVMALAALNQETTTLLTAEQGFNNFAKQYERGIAEPLEQPKEAGLRGTNPLLLNAP